jgi:hypothetical protein
MRRIEARFQVIQHVSFLMPAGGYHAGSRLPTFYTAVRS